MLKLKTNQEVASLEENAHLLAELLVEVALRAEPGVSTKRLDRLAEEWIREAGAVPAFLGYRGYPATLCASVNEEILHGIPSDRRVLEEGSILSLDLGLLRNGYYADAAVTIPVGEVTSEAQRLMAATHGALQEAMGMAKIGGRVSDLSNAIDNYVRRSGFRVVREFVGHGIGRELHEDPQIPNFGPPGQGAKLWEGLVAAVEVMAKTDDEPAMIREDGWTAVTASGGLSAHYEEMVAVTADGPQLLTQGVWEAYCRKRM
ncbi:MAG: type I methionyl aminopeptidase [Candidatus Bipolaricaulota bacterium]